MSTKENEEWNDENELKASAPLLFGMDKGKEEFKVPDGYFDNFHARLQDRINEPEPKSALERAFAWLNWKIAVPALATCAIVIGFLVIGGDDPAPTDPMEILANIDLDSVEFPIEAYEDDMYIIDDEVFEEFLDKQDALIADVNDASAEDFDKDELIDYLIDSGISLDEIVEEM